eukprot:GILJ01023059.1.p1 GENE.GILJ01023059.1~~GILJ01023059.1.p1  ORF type:complete len:440 (-),score=47.28 GILJ01023059.1:981-2300(-)
MNRNVMLSLLRATLDPFPILMLLRTKNLPMLQELVEIVDPNHIHYNKIIETTTREALQVGSFDILEWLRKRHPSYEFNPRDVIPSVVTALVELGENAPSFIEQTFSNEEIYLALTAPETWKVYLQNPLLEVCRWIHKWLDEHNNNNGVCWSGRVSDRSALSINFVDVLQSKNVELIEWLIVHGYIHIPDELDYHRWMQYCFIHSSNAVVLQWMIDRYGIQSLYTQLKTHFTDILDTILGIIQNYDDNDRMLKCLIKYDEFRVIGALPRSIRQWKTLQPLNPIADETLLFGGRIPHGLYDQSTFNLLVQQRYGGNQWSDAIKFFLLPRYNGQKGVVGLCGILKFLYFGFADRWSVILSEIWKLLFVDGTIWPFNIDFGFKDWFALKFILDVTPPPTVDNERKPKILSFLINDRDVQKFLKHYDLGPSIVKEWIRKFQLEV